MNYNKFHKVKEWKNQRLIKLSNSLTKINMIWRKESWNWKDKFNQLIEHQHRTLTKLRI